MADTGLEQASRMRDLAQELRRHAADTDNPDFIAKFERAAAELEEVAYGLERAPVRPRLAS